MFKKIIIASSLLFLFSGCDPFEGVLSVKQNFTVKSTEKQPGCSPDQSFGCDQIVDVKFPTGDVAAKFEFPSKTQIFIQTRVSGKKKTLTLDLPKKLNIPNNGEFSISAADLGQNFGAGGRAETKVEDGPIRRENESCTYQKREYFCYVVNGQTVCREELRTVWGYRMVEYQERNTNQKIAVSFGQGENVFATFNGQRAFTDKIYHYQGQCF